MRRIADSPKKRKEINDYDTRIHRHVRTEILKMEKMLLYFMVIIKASYLRKEATSQLHGDFHIDFLSVSDNTIIRNITPEKLHLTYPFYLRWTSLYVRVLNISCIEL